jgi:hypothetical protein
MLKKNSRTIKEIKEALPGINDEKVEVLSDELDKVLALKRLWSSEDGEQLLTVLRNNCSVALRKATILAEQGDKDKLLAMVLKYSANMDLLSTIQDISTEDELRKQLDEAVKEAMRV